MSQGETKLSLKPMLVPIQNEYKALLKLVFRDYSAVTVRIGARQSSAEFTFLPRLGTTGRATDGEGLFWTVLFLIMEKILSRFRA